MRSAGLLPSRVRGYALPGWLLWWISACWLLLTWFFVYTTACWIVPLALPDRWFAGLVDYAMRLPCFVHAAWLNGWIAIVLPLGCRTLRWFDCWMLPAALLPRSPRLHSAVVLPRCRCACRARPVHRLREFVGPCRRYPLYRLRSVRTLRLVLFLLPAAVAVHCVGAPSVFILPGLCGPIPALR